MSLFPHSPLFPPSPGPLSTPLATACIGVRKRLGGFEDDYIIFDCPGQIELYTHIPVMKQLVQHVLQQDYRVAAVYLLDVSGPPKKKIGGG